MAEVLLGKFEMDNDKLPPVCIVCGAATDGVIDVRFSCRSDEGQLISASATVNRINARVPICAAHRKHWKRTTRSFVMFLIVAGLFLLVLLTPLLFSMHGPTANRLSGLGCVGMFVCFLIWLPIGMYLDATCVKAKQITARSLTLTRVSEAFATALARQRVPPLR